MSNTKTKVAVAPTPVVSMTSEAIDRALIKAMPILARQDRNTVMWTWLRGAYEAGRKDKTA